MSSLPNELEEFKRLYHKLHDSARIVGKQPFFKITNKSSKNIDQLFLPTSEETRARVDLEKNLWIVLRIEWAFILVVLIWRFIDGGETGV